MSIISTAAELEPLRVLMGCMPADENGVVAPPSDPFAILFLIAGTAGSAGALAYAGALTCAGADPRRHAFMIQDLSLLGEARSLKWFGNELNRYSVYRVDASSFVKLALPAAELLFPEGDEADGFAVLDAFTETVPVSPGCEA